MAILTTETQAECVAEITAGILLGNITLNQYDSDIVHALSTYTDDARFEWCPDRKLMIYQGFVTGNSGDKYRIEFLTSPHKFRGELSVYLKIMYVFNITQKKMAFLDHEDGDRLLYRVTTTFYKDKSLARFIMEELSSMVNMHDDPIHKRKWIDK